jgi:Asp-tRNA(Asn)/Glu-tRNA(Gln) amidotransferase B subunit
MSEPQAYLNGQFLPASQARISVVDAGFVLGAAVAEQVRTFRGGLFRLEDHLNRLARSLELAAMDAGMSPAELAAVGREVLVGSITRAQGREVLAEHASSGALASAIILARGFRQISDAGTLGAAVDRILADNPAAVADYRAGKAQAVGFLVGQVMKATGGQANAALVQSAVRERLAAAGGEGS